MAKNVIVAYILWLVGGWLGLHHVYLGRDRHALVWWCTAGGCMGIGWFRDLFRIPDYVDEANDEKEYVEEMKQLKRSTSCPPFSILRFMGEVIVAVLYGVLVRAAVPEELIEKHLVLRIIDVTLVPCAVALGVHLVGNIGQERASLKIAVIGAYLMMPFYWFNPGNITYMAFTSAIAVNWKGKSWFLKPGKKAHVCRRLLVLILCASLYSSLLVLTFSQNVYITTKDKQKVLIKDALVNFFTSPAWEETKETMYKVLASFDRHGFWGAWEELVMNLDPEGEYNAYQVLELTSQASEKEVATNYRKLVQKWHPDKHKDPEEKAAAQERFMAIQKAYETISQINGRRAKINSKKDSS